ncbi:MAG TPA: hypothetical protein VKU37_12415 [Verrucomicrobiae bacterium]|nr:hypothetical protein [Verrucomicrobiae bacterium]
MNWQLLGPLLVTTVVAICSWFVVHALNIKRERISKQKEQRILYLIEAYRRLESCAHRGDELDSSKLESAVADIQLFGTSRQVELVQTFTTKIAADGSASMDDLLQDLRQDLRIELKLEPVAAKTVHVRFREGKIKKSQQNF